MSAITMECPAVPMGRKALSETPPTRSMTHPKLRRSNSRIQRSLTVSNLAESFREPIPVGITLYVVTDWNMCFVHHQRHDGQWTVPPGNVMYDSLVDPKEIRVEQTDVIRELYLPDYESLTFCLTDDTGLWENNYHKNYNIIDSGKWILKHGSLRKLLPLCGAPVLLHAEAVGVRFVFLTWNPPVEGEATVFGYVVYRDGVPISDLLDKRDFLDEEKLTGTTIYRYAVAAFNMNREPGALTRPIDVRTSEPGCPHAPKNLHFSERGETSIRLAWTAPVYGIDVGAVQYYRIWRDGVPLTFVDGSCAEYLDMDVEPQMKYAYAISAGGNIALALEWRRSSQKLEPVPRAEATDERDWIKKLAVEFKTHRLVMESELSEFRVFKAEMQEPVPKLWSKEHRVLIQGFNWNSSSNNDGWYRVLKSQLEDMKNGGINMLWLPPPSQSVSSQGYMPSKLYVLESRYGTEAELRDLIISARSCDINTVVDFIANHRCGSKQDKYGQWTRFENPDWESWAICKNNKQSYHHVSNNMDTGALSDCAPDIDHCNNQVRKDYRSWIRWLFHDIGFRGVRIDMAPGYAAKRQLEYLSAVNNPFTVGEYWSGDVNVLRNYVNATQRRVAVYDFAFYFHLRRACETGDYQELRKDGNRLSGFVGEDPGLAVTFIDNHDTEHLDFVGRFAGGNVDKVLCGYAIILTHPGTPCIYWTHFSDSGQYARECIQKMGIIRKSCGVHAQSGIEIREARHGCYGAFIYGDYSRLAVGIGGWYPGNGWYQKLNHQNINIWTQDF